MPTPFETAVTEYLRSGNPAQRTRKEYSSTLRKWARWGGGVPLDELGRKEIREFLDWMYEDAAGLFLAEAAIANGFNAPYLVGDANLDGTVDGTDLNTLGENWLGDTISWQWGDFNADGIVNAGDLNKIGMNWLATIPVAANAQHVPEPTSAVLLLFGCIGIVRRCRQIAE